MWVLGKTQGRKRVCRLGDFGHDGSFNRNDFITRGSSSRWVQDRCERAGVNKKSMRRGNCNESLTIASAAIAIEIPDKVVSRRA